MMFTSHIEEQLLQRARQKFENNPGFFEGVADAIHEFHVVDFIQLHLYWKEINLYLKSYCTEGLSVSSNGEIVHSLHPFETDSDIDLAFYLLINYLK